MWRRDAAEPVAKGASRIADPLNLNVLAEWVGDLQIPRFVCLRIAAGSSSGSSVRPFIFSTSSSRLLATTKSAPWRLNASTGPVASLFKNRSCRTALWLLPVMSGFCSEPERANSFLMIFWFKMNQEWSYLAISAVVRRWRRVPKVS